MQASFLNSVVSIGHHLTMSKIFAVTGEDELSEIEYDLANDTVISDGYKSGCKGSSDEPDYLKFYPEFKGAWEFGFNQGQEINEIENCSGCNDPDHWFCLRHDMI